MAGRARGATRVRGRLTALHHERTGSGPPVVFLHPGVGDSGVWDPQWDAYAPRFRLVRCDLPGFGRSPIDRPTINLASDVASLLDRLGLRGCAVVGNSLGGRLALQLALGRPDLVRALVLVGTLLRGGEAASAALRAYDEAARRAVEAGDLDRATEIDVEMWLADGVDRSVREAVRRMRRRALDLQAPWGDELTEEMLVADVQTRLAEIAVPTLVVVGDDDVEDVLRCARGLRSSIAGAELVLVEGAAHVPSLESPEAFDAAVLPFLERVLL